MKKKCHHKRKRKKVDKGSSSCNKFRSEWSVLYHVSIKEMCVSTFNVNLPVSGLFLFP